MPRFNYTYEITFELRSDHDQKHVTAQELAEALQTRLDRLRASGNPDEILEACGDPIDAEEDWRYGLHPGDEVTWNDPDEGACSRTGVICEIVIEGDVAKLTFRDGWHSEVRLDELS